MRTFREAQSLASWADARSVLTARSQPPQRDELTGGEHFVELHEESGLVFKSTLPGKFGFSADVEMIHPKGK